MSVEISGVNKITLIRYPDLNTLWLDMETESNNHVTVTIRIPMSDFIPLMSCALIDLEKAIIANKRFEFAIKENNAPVVETKAS